jgi:Protein of unknown function (DUF2762).
MGVEGELIRAALGNGLWAALFVFMLIYVLRTSGEREKRLIDALEKLSERFGILEDVKEGVARIERRIEDALKY